MRGDPQVVSSAGVVANLVVTPTLIFTLFDVVTSLIEFLLPEHITMKAESPINLTHLSSKYRPQTSSPGSSSHHKHRTVGMSHDAAGDAPDRAP